MKIKTYHILFRFLSYLSDKTNGTPIIVKYKLLLGTLILSITASSANAMEKIKMEKDTVPNKPDYGEITCYKPTVPTKNNSNSRKNIKITGIVQDNTGETLIGATITIKGNPATKISTDVDGKFNLVVNKNDTLIVSFFGYDSREIKVADIKDRHIILEEAEIDENMLQEVVVFNSNKSKIISCYTTITIEDKHFPDSSSKLKIDNVIPKKKDSSRQISGIVTERNGEPLIGASVVVKNTTNGVVTDTDGKFKLNVRPMEILTISYIGFLSLEIPVNNLKEDKPIIMEEDNMILCYDPVVVPYSYQDDIYKRSPKRITKLSYNEVQTPPISPVGNLDHFQDWVSENVQYNERMLQDKMEGEVILSFAIDKRGKITDKKVIGKLSSDADKEALRILTSSKDWTPGIHNGKKIKTTMVITVNFRMPK